MFIRKIFNSLTKDFSKIYPLLNKQLKLRSFGIFALMVLQSLLELFFIFTLTDMAIALTSPEVVRSSVLYEGIFSIIPAAREFTKDPKHLLIVVGTVVILINMVKNLSNFFTARSVAFLGEDISLGIGQEIMSRFLYQDYAWHLSPESKEMYQRMIWRGRLGDMLTQVLTLYATLLTVLILFVSLVGAEPILTTLIVFVTSLIGLILFTHVRKKVDVNALKSAGSAKEETAALLCITKGIREVIIYRKQETFLGALNTAALKGREPRTFLSLAPTLPTWVLESVGFIVVLIAVIFLVYYEQADTARISAALGLLVLTAWRVLPYCNRVISLQISTRTLRPMAYAVIELLEKLRTLPNMEHSLPDKNFTFNESIRLQDICFRYAGATKNSLDNISLTIKKGEKIGIIGASGGGKTTLAGVLSGLLLPTQGSIFVDDKILTESMRVALSEHTGYVPQSPFLFNGTLAENVAFKDWNAKWDEQMVITACRHANVDFVHNHTDGISRVIGEGGTGLSGGQAQRVSIARAMYSTPSLLIFDEATSALDNHNEQIIKNTIESLTEKVTCIIIAHRLTTVQNCNRLIWIDDGKIVMEGPTAVVLEAFQ